MGVDLTPQVLDDQDDRLVVEESHFSRTTIRIIGIILGCLFVVPGIQSGSMIGLIIGLVLGLIVVGTPFLIVLALSKYRRVEFHRGTDVRCVTFYQFRKPRSVHVTWDEIERIVCERRKDSSNRPGRIFVTLHRVDGSEQRLLTGWYSEELTSILARHCADKFEAVESRSPF